MLLSFINYGGPPCLRVHPRERSDRGQWHDDPVKIVLDFPWFGLILRPIGGDALKKLLTSWYGGFLAGFCLMLALASIQEGCKERATFRVIHPVNPQVEYVPAYKTIAARRKPRRTCGSQSFLCRISPFFCGGYPQGMEPCWPTRRGK